MNVNSLADLFSLRKHLKVGVYYASQTGMAKSVAGIVKEKLGQFVINLGFGELNSLDVEEIGQFDVLVLCVSTTGQGDVPDNGFKFWNRIRKVKGQDWSKVRVYLLALGSTEYSSFCAAGKMIWRRFFKNGVGEGVGEGVGGIVLADDVAGSDMEKVVDKWVENVVDGIKDLQNVNQNLFMKFIT